MATRRWLGTATDIAQVTTIAVTGTWATGDTGTVTINGNDVTVTAGTTVTTTEIASILSLAINANTATENLSSDESRNIGGQEIPEFTEITASASSGTLTLTGDTAGKPVTISVSETTAGDGALGSPTDATAATGKSTFGNADNWSGGAVPVDSDDIVFDRGSVSCLYGLAPAIQPGSVTINQAYTGTIGLPEINEDAANSTYREYRTQYLTFDNNAATCTYTIGEGEGAGSSRIKIDSGAGQSTLNILGNGQRVDSGVPALVWIGTHASNEINSSKSDLGIAFVDGESATVATLRIGYRDNQAGDSAVVCGDGCTLTTISKDGGTLDVRSAVTTLTHQAGDADLNGTGTVGTLTVRGGNVRYNRTGTLTTATVSNDGHLDFSRDMRAKTVTNPIEKYGPNAKISDPFQVVGSLVIDYNENASYGNDDIGRNVRLTRGTPA